MYIIKDIWCLIHNRWHMIYELCITCNVYIIHVFDIANVFYSLVTTWHPLTLLAKNVACIPLLFLHGSLAISLLFTSSPLSFPSYRSLITPFHLKKQVSLTWNCVFLSLSLPPSCLSIHFADPSSWGDRSGGLGCACDAYYHVKQGAQNQFCYMCFLSRV